MKPILSIKDLSYSYHTTSGETPAIDNINLDIRQGEFVSIVGPSGCGKSTLLSLICGLLKPDKGSIELEPNTRIGYMLQKDNLFEWRSIYSNILLGLEIQKKDTPKARKNIDNMLDAYGLSEFKKSRPSQLSGGMRQRAALIRTLALEPDILLLDEPFSALDYQTRLTVSDDIGSIIKSQEKTAILVTHDIAEAISMGDRVIVLSDRPGTINNIIPIKLTIENRTPFSSRSAPEFNDYFNTIWKELNNGF
ncbi:MAG: ABC transporter ATP-binding protein [Lachnospiraceae bacterium]